jgi:hypothetical protein
MNNLSRQEATHELWRRGLLKYLCHPVQKEMYDLFYNSEPHSTLVWVLGRQSGKTYLLVILAIESALRKPNSIIKIVTDTKLHAKTIVEPKFTELLANCPQDLKPKYNTSNFTYHFTNNSQIQLAGSDGKNYERLRGQKADLVLIDEAGFCRDLGDMIRSVLLPTTTHTGGKIVLATTPPKDPDHDFFSFMEKAQYEGKYVLKTIYDNPLIKPEDIQRMARELGGEHTEQFRREYLCEIIRSEDLVVIPEFTPEVEKEIIKEWQKPPYFDCYVGMDLGFKDLTVALFAYYDFRHGKLIVEDELVIDFQKSKSNLENFTYRLLQIEDDLWRNKITDEKQDPLLRVSDINPFVVNEISKYSNHQIYFTPADKWDKDASINNLRSLIGSEKIIINPKCETLIRHLRNVKWSGKGNKDTFARSPDDGHYDAVDALKYLVRAVNFKRNPYPAHYNLDVSNTYFKSPLNNKPTSDPKQVFAKIFGVKKAKKYGILR